MGFIIALLFSFQFSNANYVIPEDYGPYPKGFELPFERFDEKLRWLYELIMPASGQQNFPAEAEKSFSVHLKDTYKIFPHPNLLAQKNLNSLNFIEGKITYAGIAQKFYRHDLIMQNGELIINVRVHLKNATEVDWQKFTTKTQGAENIWNASRVPMDFPYRFKFEIVRDPKIAHYSVNVKDNTRGPYDTNWSRGWIASTIAHEMGHMLGLGDEYKTLSGKMDCLRDSIMCDDFSGKLQPFHYYFVLRRLIKATL